MEGASLMGSVVHHFVIKYVGTSNRFRTFLNACLGNLRISSSTARLRQSGEICGHKGQGGKSAMNACDLQYFRQHCSRNQHDSIQDIITQAQKQRKKTFGTVHHCIYKMQKLRLPSGVQAIYNIIQKLC